MQNKVAQKAQGRSDRAEHWHVSSSRMLGIIIRNRLYSNVLYTHSGGKMYSKSLQQSFRYVLLQTEIPLGDKIPTSCLQRQGAGHICCCIFKSVSWGIKKKTLPIWLLSGPLRYDIHRLFTSKSSGSK